MATKNAMEAGTVISTGEIVEGAFVPASIGYWRFVAHDDGYMVSIAPVDGESPVAITVGADATVQELVSALQQAGSTITGAMFGEAD